MLFVLSIAVTFSLEFLVPQHHLSNHYQDNFLCQYGHKSEYKRKKYIKIIKSVVYGNWCISYHIAVFCSVSCNQLLLFQSLSFFHSFLITNLYQRTAENIKNLIVRTSVLLKHQVKLNFPFSLFFLFISYLLLFYYSLSSFRFTLKLKW